MKNYSVISTAVVFLFFACNNGHKPFAGYTGPKIVEAKGYVVPADSMAKPVVIPVDESTLKKIPIGKPKVVPIHSNVHPAGKPNIVVAGTPRICTPGQNGFSLPVRVPAIDHTFIAGIPEIVEAQDPATKDSNPHGFRTFDKLQGLKDNNILCMLEDDSGNLWFGTLSGGVSKYDGKYFTHFTEKEGLSNNYVPSMLQDRSGNMWFGTWGGGVSKYDGKSFTNFTEAEGLSSNIVRSIEEDKAGNIWFATDGGVSKYDGKSFSYFTKTAGLSGNNVLSILESQSGDLWFGTDGGVSKYDGKSFTNFTEKEGLSNNEVNRILEDHSGNLWFGTNGGGVSKYDGKSFTNFGEKEGLSNNTVRSMLVDRSGNLWFGTLGGGVSMYNGERVGGAEATFTHFTEKEGLFRNDVFSILEDKSGNLWFGTWQGGVSKYDGNSFMHFTEKEGLSRNKVTGILQDQSGDLWFCTAGGVSKYDGKSFTNLTKAEGLLDNNVGTVLKDQSNNLWFVGDGGVSKYDGKSFIHFTEKEGLTNNSVGYILEGKSGNLWFAIWGGGACKYDGKSFTHFTEKQGLSSNLVYAIEEDRSGNIWFGTWGGGVTKYDGKSFTHFTEKEGLSNNFVSSIVEDRSGNLWFGTDGGGVCKYDGKSFTHFTEQEGLSNNIVWSIREDHSGNLWFGTQFGVSKLLNDHDQVKSGSRPEHHSFFKHYGYDDGLLGVGYNALYEDKNGLIWMGGDDRLTVYDPSAKAETDTIPPNIQITALQLFNEKIPWVNLEKKIDSTFILENGVEVGNLEFDSTAGWYGLPEHLSLAYDNNYLTLNFVGITMNQSKKVKYKYTLEGMDNNWSALTSRTEAPYGNLPPGSYVFKVKAMNSDGYWSKEFKYPIIIRSPWWYSWWAYGFYSLIFCGAVLMVHRYQKVRVLRKERERTQHKELEQAKEIKKAYDQLEESHTKLKATQTQLIQSEKMASLGELTAGIAHEIQNPLNFVNNFSEVNKELLVEMKEELDKGNLDDAKTIATEVIENEEKITHHGKRADAIVKGMLQHSRSSSGVKELTDINALADEYLRLAYHGLRAKDKAFTATLKTNFDESVGSIAIIPQDIGRVLLNLITNAFYAVAEKRKQKKDANDQTDYEPTVLVTTKKIVDKILISVKDNGSGIAQDLLNKIFQPFFTTKPTGQGTGLGLSLSYDMVKAHGGELRVETKENEGSEFIIQLPINSSK